MRADFWEKWELVVDKWREVGHSGGPVHEYGYAEATKRVEKAWRTNQPRDHAWRTPPINPSSTTRLALVLALMLAPMADRSAS
ncbi:MAG: hypothetical protein HKO03_09945 [Acidimicrobiia bacterium]|nr:hypothetical protein [Acidimicrobiia bacterium]